MYDENKKILEELRSKNQAVVEKEFDTFVNNLKYQIIKDKNTYIDKDPNKGLLYNLGIRDKQDIFYQSIIYIALLIFGIVVLFPDHLESMFLYIFGMIFFISGFNIGIYNKGFGLIFVFSHGGIGLGVMLSSLINDRFNINIISDLSGNLKNYIILISAILLVGVLGVIIYNLSDSLKLNKYNKIIILLLFVAVIVLVGFLPLVKY